MGRRSRWLSRRLWLIAVAEIALLTRGHWRRLQPEERRRLIELARKSKGRPSKLSNRERREFAELLDKLDYAGLGGDVTSTLLPFRPLGRLVEYVLGRPAAKARRREAGKT